MALAFNTTGNKASVARKDLTAGNLTIVSVIDGDTTILATSLAAGGVGIGAIVAAGFSEADNTAQLDISDSIMKLARIVVQAGTAEKPNDNQALVFGVTGAVGSMAANLNIGIAQNSGYNRALVTGSSNGTLDASSLVINAIGLGRSYVVLASAAAGSAAVQASVAVAYLKNVQEARMDCESDVNITGAVNVNSVQKTSGSDFSFGGYDLTISADTSNNKLKGAFSSMAQALVFTAGVGALAATVSTANAISDATSRAMLRAENLSAGAIRVSNDAESTAVANIATLGIGAISVGLHAGYAYAKGTFEALVQTKGNVDGVETNITGSSLDISNTYISDAKAIITPALGGVQAGLANADVNTAVAMNLTKARTGILGGDTSGGVIRIAGPVTINADGIARSEARVNTPDFSASVASITANVVVADVKAEQNTLIENVALHADKLTMNSNLNSESQFDKNDGSFTGALAILGGSYAEGLDVSLISATVNSANAIFDGRNHSYVHNADLIISNAMAIHANSTSFAKGDVELNSSLGFASLFLTQIYSYAGGSFGSYVDNGAGQN